MAYLSRCATLLSCLVLVLSCLCVGFKENGVENTSTTKIVTTTFVGVDESEEESGSSSEEDEWGEEYPVSTTETTYELWPDTTFEPAEESTLPSTTTEVLKKTNGLSCSRNDECVSGYCINSVCCSVGQCSFRNACYGVGEARADGRVCQRDGSWKKPYGSVCYTGVECVTGYCKDGVCCSSAECGSAFVGRCYSLGQISFDQTEVCVRNDEGVGVWKKKDGEPCRVNSSCASGFCVGSVCVSKKT